MIRRALAVALLLAGCPAQHERASFYSKNKPADGTDTCAQTLECYDRCVPLVEECMLQCDGHGSYYPVQHARDVANCTAQAGCSPDDHACRDQYCGAQVQACMQPAAGPPPAAPVSPPAPGTEPMPPQPVRE